MRGFSQRTLNVPPSEIRRMFAMQEGMEDVISFALGEPDFDAPEHVTRAIVDSYERCETHYTPNRGLKPLRAAIAAEYKSRGLDYSEDEILITPGAVGALNLISMLLLQEGDEVHAMTGIRLGYLAAPEHMVDHMNTLLENVFSCISEPVQWGGVAALEGGREDVEKMKAVYRKRRRRITDGLNSIGGIFCANPAGAFYVFPDISGSGLSSADFAMCLLQEEHVAVIPGSGFGAGGEGFVRLSYAVDMETIDEGLRRIRRFMENRAVRRG